MAKRPHQEAEKQTAEAQVAQWVERIVETHGGRPNPEGRIRIIMALMSRNMWVTGRTAEDIAPILGVKPGTLHKESGEASRRIRDLARTDMDTMRARLLVSYEAAIALAMEQGKPETIIRGLDSIRDTFGLAVAKQIELRVDPLHGMSDDELRRIADEAGDSEPTSDEPTEHD